MVCLSRHLVVYLIAIVSVLSLLAAGQSATVDEYVENSWCHETGLSLVDTAVLDSAPVPPDGPERDSEEDPETELFAPLRALLQATETNTSIQELSAHAPVLPKGRKPLLSIYRPPRC